MSGADESWLDYFLGSGRNQNKEYQLRLRRGALIVTLVLSNIDEETQKDPQGTLVALADRVLQRVGDLGRTDTGVTPMLRLEVGGKGKAQQILYSVPDHKFATLKNVKLPWKIDLPLADRGDSLRNFMLSGQTPIARNGYPSAVSCRVVADGTVLEQAQNIGFASCGGHLPAS